MRLASIRPTDLIIVGWLVIMLVLTVVGPFVVGDATKPVGIPFTGPEAGLPFGTDNLGRDVAQRVATGGAGLIAVAAVSTVVAVIVGISFGFILSIRRTAVRVLAVLLDVILMIPSMLTMMIVIFGLGSGITTMIIVTTVVSAPFVARYTRSLTRPILDSDYVLHARASGDSWGVVMVREVAPNLIGPWLADAGMRFVGAMYLVSAAGFLGFSPLGSDQDWATMVQEGLAGMSLNPWATLAPTIALAAITIPANLAVDRAVKAVPS